MKQNLDGVSKNRTSNLKFPRADKPVLVMPQGRAVDSVVRVRIQRAIKSLPAYRPVKPFFGTWLGPFFRQRLALPGLSIALFLSFCGGIAVTLNTTKTQADEPAPQIMSQPAAIPLSPVVSGVAVANVPNEVLFNMTIEQLDIYLAEALKTPEMKEAERLAVRKGKLKEYLKEKKSPFVEIVDTLAELKHWKLVLAISNSESTLGKRCYNNNCSGIGVEPGHPLWRDYSTKAEWAKDLDRLLEKRYKDWTLEKMNGVYNKPGSNNWVLAAKQVLEDLEERKIN